MLRRKKEKILGKWVKFSESTLKANRTMVVNEYRRLISSREERIGKMAGGFRVVVEASELRKALELHESAKVEGHVDDERIRLDGAKLEWECAFYGIGYLMYDTKSTAEVKRDVEESFIEAVRLINEIRSIQTEATKYLGEGVFSVWEKV